jgi:hypothetical protein
MLSSYREGLSRWSYFIYLNQHPVFYSQNICHSRRWQSFRGLFLCESPTRCHYANLFHPQVSITFTKIVGETQSFIPSCPKWMTNFLNYVTGMESTIKTCELWGDFNFTFLYSNLKPRVVKCANFKAVVPEDSVLVDHDAASMGNQFPTFRGNYKGQNVLELLDHYRWRHYVVSKRQNPISYARSAIWYMIYLLTAIGLTPGGSSTLHIYP